MDKNENQETKIREKTVEWLLKVIKVCPQVAKEGIGAEAFAEELIKSGQEFDKHFPETSGAIKLFLPFIEVCPQILNPKIGIKVFFEELCKAAVIFDMHIKKT